MGEPLDICSRVGFYQNYPAEEKRKKTWQSREALKHQSHPQAHSRRGKVTDENASKGTRETVQKASNKVITDDMDGQK